MEKTNNDVNRVKIISIDVKILQAIDVSEFSNFDPDDVFVRFIKYFDIF